MANETHTGLLEEGQKVSLIIPEQEQPYTVIIESVKDDAIEISAPLSKGYYVPAELGSNVLLRIGNRNGFFTIPFIITGREAGIFNSLKLTPSGDVRKVQRRELLRMEIFIDFDLEFPYESVYKPPTGFKILKGKRGNLSGGGIFFWSNKPLVIGTKLNVRLNLEPHYARPVIAQAKIARVDQSKVQSDLFGIAIQFTSIREGDRDKIISYVLHKERSFLRKVTSV